MVGHMDCSIRKEYNRIGGDGDMVSMGCQPQISQVISKDARAI